MRHLKRLWRDFFDIREGELARTALMSLYLMCVLFAYYIVKVVSRAMFVANFNPDKLPWLYILIAAFGGMFAYGYTRLAIRTSLGTAVNAAIGFFIGTLVLLWWILGFKVDWTLYVFNVYTSLIGIVLVSQGWLVAANVFNPREAKRLYGILGLGAVLGAAFGGTFAAIVAQYVDAHNLVLAAAFMVLLAFFCYRGAVRRTGASLSRTRAIGEEDADFSLGYVARAVGKFRHLQVIVAIIAITYIVDVMIEFQLNAQAKLAFGEDTKAITRFLGAFYGIYLNIATVIFQGFLTGFIVSRLGIGGALQIMPITIIGASLFNFFHPRLLTAGAARLLEASTRYTFNRTGMELLFLPLPIDLKNRTKAFMDIFVDRLSRGIGGIILVLLTDWLVLEKYPHRVSLLVIGFAVVWIFLSERGRREYIATVRKRLETRRLDFDVARLKVRDPATIRLLEQTIESDNPRQAAYALRLLAGASGYAIQPRLASLAGSPHGEVRTAVFEIARTARTPDLLEQALAETRSSRGGDRNSAVAPAVAYALTVSPDPRDLARRLLDHPSYLVVSSVLEWLADQPEMAQDVVTLDWLAACADSGDPERRALAAIAVAARGDHGTEALHKLLGDPDTTVAKEAIRTAGKLRERVYLADVIRHLADAKTRGAAIDALAAFGVRVSGTLADLLEDDSVAVAIRRQIPRILQAQGDQRAVDVLLRNITQRDLTVRAAVLRALQRIRENKPNLNYGGVSVQRQILDEAKYYYELNAALAPFCDKRGQRGPAGLLAATLEERLRLTLERMFHLLGLRYPPREVYAAYLAVNRGRREEVSHALEFLDNILERELKRIMMPLIDSEDRAAHHGSELFGIEVKDAATAIRELIRSGDDWLASCAMATAAELRLGALRPEIEEASRTAGPVASRVAGDALAQMA
jgi:AAA family ATP:ADP antiporter